MSGIEAAILPKPINSRTNPMELEHALPAEPTAATVATNALPASVTAEVDRQLAVLSEHQLSSEAAGKTAVTSGLSADSATATAIVVDHAQATSQASEAIESFEDEDEGWEWPESDNDAVRAEIRELLAECKDQLGDAAIATADEPPAPTLVPPSAEAPSLAGLRRLIAQQLRGEPIGDAMIGSYATLAGVSDAELPAIRERVRGRVQAADLLAELDREESEREAALAEIARLTAERERLSITITTLIESLPPAHDNSEVRRSCSGYLLDSIWPDDRAKIDQLVTRLIDVCNDLNGGMRNAAVRASLKTQSEAMEREMEQIRRRP